MVPLRFNRLPARHRVVAPDQTVQQPEQAPEQGPGTELHRLLGKLGVKVNPNCSCTAHIRDMNRNGVNWCRNNIDTVVSWLETESGKRGLPFVRFAAVLLVKRAIRNAELKSRF